MGMRKLDYKAYSATIYQQQFDLGILITTEIKIAFLTYPIHDDFRSRQR